MTIDPNTPGAKITYTDGTVEYRVGLPSEIMREVREIDPGVIVGPRRVRDFPVERGGRQGAPVEVGDRVTVTHIGVAKTGRVVKVGRTRVHVEVVVYAGTPRERTKTIVVPKTEVVA